MQEKASKKKQLKGVVVSDKMEKTLVVEIKRLKVDSLYKKRRYVSKRLKVHDSKNDGKIGDKVLIEQSRPYSKEKCWRLRKVYN